MRGDAFRALPLLVLFSFCIHSGLCGQEKKDTVTFRVMSYNVENLFDCTHDSLKNDVEFLPEAVRRWNYARYRKKLDAVARVITAVGEWGFPALVALCEVENDSVLRDLTRYSALRRAGYRYVMTHSSDERGIDVALLYRRHLFKLLSHHSFVVPRPGKHSRPTRDVLHVCGLLLNKDTLDVLVCHFPSRASGAKASEPYRFQAAQVVRQVADSLCRVRQRLQLLVMGDFNDPPQARAIREVLKVQDPPEHRETSDACTLYHLLAQAATGRDFGSYKYRGEWQLLDHLIVSGNMLRPDAPLYTVEGRVAVLPFLLSDDEKYGGKQPFRTYYGMKYLGGYSDHLPVWAEFRLVY